MPLIILYFIFFSIIFIILFFSIKNIINLYEEITFGAGLEKKHYRFIYFIHLFILIFSAIIIYFSHYLKKIYTNFEIKSFLYNLSFAIISIFIIIILFLFLSEKYLRKIFIEPYLDLLDEDEDMENINKEYDEKLTKQKYNDIIFNVVGQLFFVYLLLFIFPISQITKPTQIPDNPKKYNIKRTIVEDARIKWGDNYLIELAKLRRRYIKRHGIQKWNEYFEWQVKDIDFTQIDRELELREMQKKLNKIEEEYKNELEKIEQDSSLIKERW